VTARCRFFSFGSGRLLVSALGGLYFTLGIFQVVRVAVSGGVLAAMLVDFLLLTIPGVVLLYGGYRLPRIDLHADSYPRVVGWCLGGFGLMLAVVGLLVLNPGGNVSRPLRAAGIATALGSVGWFGIGLNEARALTRAAEAEAREQALQDRTAELRTLIDLLPVAVFVAEAGGRIVEWNEAAEAIWGGEIVESESVAEYDQYEAWWADTGEPVEADEWPLARALRGEEVTDPAEIQIKGFDGELRTVLNHGMPVRDENGEVRRAVVTLIDITERKEYQRRLETSNERLEQFAYAASHDLQEPLRMVSSYLRLLKNRYAADLNEEAREYIEFAVDGATRMSEMVEGLLEYSRVNRRANTFEAVDLEAVFITVLADLQVRIEETDAEITTESLPQVYGDEEQLRRVLQNLLDNAIEYSGNEPPRANVSAERDGDEWTITIDDEGIGIDPDYQDRVFDGFERLHSRDEHEGTGTSLALCERIVERHGGDIWVESEPGERSTSHFTVPAGGGPPESVVGSGGKRRTPGGPSS
jgi:PAS domain S-box-containing protein